MKPVFALGPALLLVACAACDGGSPPEPPTAKPPSTQKPLESAAAAAPEVRRLPAAKRIVAIGDLHGDLEATRRALRTAGAIDEKDAWIGGDLVIVQTGDDIDRGDQDKAVLDLIERLEGEAKKAGGALVALNGNHEIMNVQGDFRYVTGDANRAFGAASGPLASDPRVAAMPESARGRAVAFLPGAPYAKMLAKRSVTVIVGDSLFVHGGVLPAHVRYGLTRIDREVSAWMDGQSKAPPKVATDEDAPVWTRRYSEDPAKADCKMLNDVLTSLGAKRMVVGHTVQKNGIVSGCDKALWCIDVGLSAHYGGPTQVLEIKGDDVVVLDSATALPSPK